MEQPLPPYGACLLGSVNLAKMVKNPFSDDASFDWDKYKKVIRIFTRMLDNVVEMNGLPLPQQQHELLTKRRHGMGFLGLGSALSLMGVTYGSEESVKLTEEFMKVMAIEGYSEGVSLAKEKGAAPIIQDKDNLVKWTESKYMKNIWSADPELKDKALEHGCRFTHATSIAPTGTISLSLNNNASNGIEPTFAHKYTRNVIKEGRKSKVAVDVFSYEMLVYKQITGEDEVPEWLSTTDNVKPEQHVAIQAAAQKWCDSSISKTTNVPTTTPFEEFKDIYINAYNQGLKGITTFRFNPDAFQGVLVKENDLNKTKYEFKLEDGSVHVLAGNEMVMYNGEESTAANLYESHKEKFYGKF